ncbi:MAG TPA: hypothetical protein VK890_01605, partial [Bacteroidia bacterium]|nr:hypothetical protein [Bacteroidia bacterium]
MRKLLRILSLLLLPLLAEASHQVSGYIKFTCIGGTEYQVTLVNYTNGDPLTTGNCSQADRDTIRMHWGDGTSDVLIRYNGIKDQFGYPGGDSICPCRKVNLYTGTHNYPGPGTYHLYIDDQDRMAYICNMTNSASQDFYLFTDLTITPLSCGGGSTPIISNPLACEYACAGQCYYYNVGAYSPEGDSISYSLGDCMNSTGVCNGYFIPAGASIDPVTGTLSWCNAVQGCPPNNIYNFSIRITTYKRCNISGVDVKAPIATMDVELEIIVNSNCNPTPKIASPLDTCVTAGDFIKFNYTSAEASGDPSTMTAVGQPFTLVPAATFSSTTGNPSNATFTWQTNCTEVSKTPYQVTVKSTDLTTGLNAYATTSIRVVAPAPTNLKATVVANSVCLHWNPSVCSQTAGYNIYRAIGCVPFKVTPCATGVSDTTGYVLIASTKGINDTEYCDNNVVPGLNYSYLVAGTYPLPDGSISYASNDTCVLVKRNIPVLTNVSVDSTATGTGTIYLRWIKPSTNILDFDTTSFPGPYTYRLMRAVG